MNTNSGGRLGCGADGSVSAGFKIRTADGTSINHVEGSPAGTVKDSLARESDRAAGFCVLARSPGDRQRLVFR